MNLINQVELTKTTLKVQAIVSHSQTSQYSGTGWTHSKGFDMAQGRLCGSTDISYVVLQRTGYFQTLICLLDVMEKIVQIINFLPRYQ